MINPSFIIIKIISLQTAITFAGNDNKTSINNNQTTQINGKIVDFNNQEGLSGVAISNNKYQVNIQKLKTGVYFIKVQNKI